MSYADRIRQAKGLPEAVLILAEGIDHVLAELGPRAASDPWAGGGWDMPPAEDRPAAMRPADKTANAEAIAAAEAALLIETDGEERLALEARLRLLKDEGQAIDVTPAQGVREVIEQVDDVATVVLPPASPERKAQRVKTAKQFRMAEYSPTLTEEQFLDAYAKGGPQWLYLGAREAVMQMPMEARHRMVADLELDSPAAAQELARDILKDWSTGISPDAQMEHIDRMSDNHAH